MNNILTKGSRKGLFDTASYLLLDVENHKLKICYARYNGLIIRRDGNILEAGKVGRIHLGSVENSNYIEGNIFLLLPGFLVFLYSDRVVEPLNPQMKNFGMAHTQSIQLKPEGTRKEILKETMLFRSSLTMILV